MAPNHDAPADDVPRRAGVSIHLDAEDRRRRARLATWAEQDPTDDAG